jgi:hypothetical protein
MTINPACRNPARHAISGQAADVGLWVMHQLGIDVKLRHANDGFTVRLRHLPESSGPAATAR